MSQTQHERQPPAVRPDDQPPALSQLASTLDHNFRVGVLNGAAFILAETFIDSGLVLPWFLAQLSASNLVIGLVVPLYAACWSLPQLFVSRQMGKLAYKMPIYRSMAVIRMLAMIGLTGAVFVLRQPGLLIASFVALYTVYGLAAGVAGLPFMDIVAKTIPARQRGRFFGARLFWGGILSIGAGYLIKLALEGQLGLRFPLNMGMLTLISTLLMMVGLTVFFQTKEPPSPIETEAASLTQHMYTAWRLSIQNRNYRLYLLACIAITAGATALPFLSVYATQTLKAGPGMIGIYLGVRTAASLISNRLWSPLADQRGGRLVMQLSSVLGGVALLIAMATLPMTYVPGLPGDVGPWLITPVFILSGIATSAYNVAGSSLMLDLAPDQNRSLYVGFANTALGIAYLVTGLGGLVADLAGYAGMFALAALCYAASAVAATRLQEVPPEAAV